MFKPRTFYLVALVAATVLPVVRAAEDKAPTVVVRVKSITGLLEDAQYLADLAGKGEEARQGAAVLNALASGEITPQHFRRRLPAR